MATEIRIPTTGNAGEDAVLVEWHVDVGGSTREGEPVLTIETAKSTLEVVAPVDGTILEQRARPGDDVAEFSVVGLIGEPGEAPHLAETHPHELSADARAHGRSLPAEETMGGEEPAEPSPEPPVPAPDAARPARVAASPRARRVASALGVDLAEVDGSGPLGRILAGDVERAAADATTASDAPPVQSGVSQPSAVVPVRGVRKVTAQRMHASLSEAAQVTLTRYANADSMLQWLERVRTSPGVASAPRVSLNDLLLYATARAVVGHPALNSWFDWEGIRHFDRVNLGFAVDTERGLFVPVIRDAHRLKLGELASQVHTAIERAREGRLQPDEMAEGTFTVSNLGGLGVHWFTPVLNAPQSGILGVGATHRDGDGRMLLPLSLTFDHRALDGGAAARALADIATAIEHVDVLDAF